MNCKKNNSDKKEKLPTYAKIKKQVLATNSITINSVSIAGESVNGLFSIFVMLSNLRLNIVNDTYHPYLYHYYVGVSVGSICICLMLNTRFLYETQGKKIALEYLDAIYDFVDYDSIRRVFLDIDGKNQLNLANPLIILKNLYKNGSFCSRKCLEDFLIGNNKDFKFDNRKQYFVTKEYKLWLDNDENLFNVFFICYSAEQTKMVTFTGNQNRYKNGINFITYKLLSHSNLIHAIICSSDIPILYPVENIDGTNFATDGASAERNQSCYLQSLINCSYYYSSNKIYGKMLAFFNITPKNNNFLIIHNKVNLQQTFENLDEYKISSIVPLLRSVQTASKFFPRVYYNATMNVPLMSLFLQQPYIQKFSTLNINDIVLTSYEKRLTTVLENIDIMKNTKFQSEIPLFKIPEKNFKKTEKIQNYKSYLKKYNKYNVMTSNQLISTFLYAYNPPENIELLDIDGKPLPLLPDNTAPNINVNICYFDMNIRNMYILDNLLTYYLVFNYKNDYIVDNIKNTKKMAVLSGNMLFNINQLQGLATYDKNILDYNATTNPDHYQYINENKNMIYSISNVINKGYNDFLGQEQS